MSQEVAILGAGGATGGELLHLLEAHPKLKVTHITSDQYSGKLSTEIFPKLQKTKLKFSPHSEKLPQGIPIFLATPDKISIERVPQLIEEENPFVDLSGAFRLHDKKVWENSYKQKHIAFECMEKVVYGMPEIFKKDIITSKTIANPGCYPTSIILPLRAIENFLGQIEFISVSSSSGVSGAGGRVENGGYSFVQINENFRAYKILRHQHESEIKEYAKINFPFVFTPHLLPIYRGILSTIQIYWKVKAPEAIKESMYNFSKDKTFLRFYEDPESVHLSKVQNTNFLDFGVRSREKTSIIISAIDNLIKGASGQAIQNMNLILGWEEDLGLLAR